MVTALLTAAAVCLGDVTAVDLQHSNAICPEFGALDAELFQLQPRQQSVDPRREPSIDEETDYAFSPSAQTFFARKATRVGENAVHVRYYPCNGALAGLVALLGLQAPSHLDAEEANVFLLDAVADAVSAEVASVSASVDNVHRAFLISKAKQMLHEDEAALCDMKGPAQMDDVLPAEGHWRSFAQNQPGKDTPGFIDKCRLYARTGRSGTHVDHECPLEVDTESLDGIYSNASGREGFLADTLAACGWLPKVDGVVLNIGAGDGEETDPIWTLVESRNYTGAFVEADRDTYHALVNNLRRRSNQNLTPVFMMAATGEHMQLLLNEAGFADDVNLDVLKVDIDSWDCDVVRAALLRLQAKPRMVWIELNWSVPPPLRFARLFHPSWLQRVSSLPRFPWTHGCSLSYAVDLLASFGYKLFAVEYNDAVFISEEIRQKALQDEGECHGLHELAANSLGHFEAFHRHSPWIFAPIHYVREWFYALAAEEAFIHIWCNVTAYDKQVGLDGFPFVLDL